MNELTDTKPELYEDFTTVAEFSDEDALMDDPVATMDDLVVTMGGSDSFNQYEAPEISLIEDTKP